MKTDEKKAIPAPEAKRLKIVLEKTDTGYSAYALDTKGIYTAGESFGEVKENIAEAIAMQAGYLEETGESGEAEKMRNAEVGYYLDVKQFFEQYPMLNKSEFASYIGMNPSQLRKISKGIVALSDNKAQQIEMGLHKLASEFQAVHFS
jgi:predicted RNase H-like HicB family nuclease